MFCLFFQLLSPCSLRDSVINEYLVKKGGLDINAGSWLGLMVSSNCQFWAPLEFPQMVECGLKVVRLGRTSVTYRVGIFGKDDDLVAASAEMIHCFVDRLTRRPIAMPTPLRNALEAILVPDSFL